MPKEVICHFSSTLFFSNNQIILAETHCSYFFCGSQTHLFFFCSCSCEVRPGDPIELEINVSDRSSNAPLKGKRIRGLYENGWFEGEIMYYNKNSFNDGTSNYIKAGYKDGVELVLM